MFGVIDLGVMIYGYLQASAYGIPVGATAIIPYIICFLITIAYAVKRRITDSIPGLFNLGRWAWPVSASCSSIPAVIMIILSVPAIFFGSDKIILYGVGLAVLWYIAALQGQLRRGTAGVKAIRKFVDQCRTGCSAPLPLVIS